jgi:hypothetical protein
MLILNFAFWTNTFLVLSSYVWTVALQLDHNINSIMPLVTGLVVLNKSKFKIGVHIPVGSSSVGIVRSRTQTTEFVFCTYTSIIHIPVYAVSMAYIIISSHLWESKSKSQSHYDQRSVSKSWCQAQSGTFDQRFFFQSYCLVSAGRPL